MSRAAGVRMLIRAGSFHAALEQLAAALARDPGDGELHTLRAIALMGLGQLEEARAAALESLRLAPQRYGSLLALGQILRRLERVREAAVALREATRIAPDRWEAHAVHARCLARIGRYAEARAHADQAVRLAPTASEARFHSAAVRFDAGQLDLAEVEIREAVRLAPEDAAALALFARVRYHQAAIEDARSAAESVVRLQPGNAAMRRFLRLLQRRVPSWKRPLLPHVLRGTYWLSIRPRGFHAVTFALAAAASLIGWLPERDPAVPAVLLGLWLVLTATLEIGRVFARRSLAEPPVRLRDDF